ncbi:MAG TPA: hypothetical protein PKE45_07450, partial [Caldilineaceae bacterium]|nr:hypothetical protein [Caldilineaceae bacterium]
QISPTPQPIFTVTPVPTPVGQSIMPTPVFTKVIKLINEISHPESSDAIAGYTTILGYASAPSFRRYDVHIAVADSESWQWVATFDRPVYDDVLVVLDTSKYPDGLYDLRVRVLREDGNYTESFLRR